MIYFITGTDTGVGKTAVAAAFAQKLTKEGRSVGYYKPVQTGVKPGETGDTQFVAAAAEIPAREGQRFPAPLAPLVAAREAGQRVEYEHLLRSARRMAAEFDALLVEGSGGLLVPLTRSTTTTESHNMADLALDLGLTVDTSLLIVANASLGTLNHTALTVEAARRRDLHVEGIVVSNWPSEPGILERSNLELLSEMAPIAGILAHVKGLDTSLPQAIPLPLATRSQPGRS